MDISSFLSFSTLDLPDEFNNPDYFKNQIVLFHESNELNLQDFHFAFIGIEDEVNGKLPEYQTGPDQFRIALYKLKHRNNKTKIIDLGNIINGKNRTETTFNIRQVLTQLIEKKVIPVIIGEHPDLPEIIIQSLNNTNLLINLTSVNANLNISNPKLNKQSSEVSILEHPSVFSFTNIGYQSCFTGSEELKKIEKHNYEAYRLGIVRNNLKYVEPVLRDTNVLEINLNAVKHADAPGQKTPSPNGLYSEDICQLAFYGGMNNSLKVFQIAGFDPEMDFNHQTANLAAQIVWYLFEGFENKVNENPVIDDEAFTRFHVHHDSFDLELEFLKSKNTGRWWLKLPYKSSSLEEKAFLLSCSYEDYQNASRNDIPDRIWKFYKKIL